MPPRWTSSLYDYSQVRESPGVAVLWVGRGRRQRPGGGDSDELRVPLRPRPPSPACDLFLLCWEPHPRPYRWAQTFPARREGGPEGPQSLTVSSVQGRLAVLKGLGGPAGRCWWSGMVAPEGTFGRSRSAQSKLRWGPAVGGWGLFPRPPRRTPGAGRPDPSPPTCQPFPYQTPSLGEGGLRHGLEPPGFFSGGSASRCLHPSPSEARLCSATWRPSAPHPSVAWLPADPRPPSTSGLGKGPSPCPPPPWPPCWVGRPLWFLLGGPSWAPRSWRAVLSWASPLLKSPERGPRLEARSYWGARGGGSA